MYVTKYELMADSRSPVYETRASPDGVNEHPQAPLWLDGLQRL